MQALFRFYARFGRRAWVGSCMDMKGCIFVRFACGIACVWFVWLSRRWFTSTIRLKAHRPAPVRGIANQQPRHDVPHLLQTHKLHAATARPAPAPRIDTNNRSRPSPLPTHNMQDLSSARVFRVEHGWRVKRMPVHIGRARGARRKSSSAQRTCDIGPGLYADVREYRSSIGLGVCNSLGCATPLLY